MTSSTRPNPTMHLPRSEPPREVSRRHPARTPRLLFALGLVMVAVFASLLWWLIRHDPDEAPPQAGGTPQAGENAAPGGERPATEPAPTVQAGRFTFEGLAPVHTTDRCEQVSYGKVRSWFADHPCARVVRGLFSARDGSNSPARAAVSVSVVTMPGDAEARKLKELTDTSGTGNVSDLLKDGTVRLPGVPEVAGGSYASSLSGPTLTIVESAFYGDTENKALLAEITTQALQVAGQLG
ncbi:MAG: hypothetical protein ACRDQB_12590 [Thermocrispum sp.]